MAEIYTYKAFLLRAFHMWCRVAKINEASHCLSDLRNQRMNQGCQMTGYQTEKALKGGNHRGESPQISILTSFKSLTNR